MHRHFLKPEMTTYYALNANKVEGKSRGNNFPTDYSASSYREFEKYDKNVSRKK